MAFAATVAGKLLCPFTEKGCPVTFNCDTFTADEPSFVSVTPKLADWPTATEPNDTLLVETTSDPVVALVPAVFVATGAVQPLKMRAHETAIRSPNRPR